MKAIAIVGSPRKNGNTEILAKHTLKAIAEEGLDTELVRLAGRDIQPCNACMICRNEERCPIDDDLFPLYTKIKEAEAIILVTPVYFGSATALLKAFMERTGYIGGVRRGGVCREGRWALVVARRAGQNLPSPSSCTGFTSWGFTCPAQPTGILPLDVRRERLMKMRRG